MPSLALFGNIKTRLKLGKKPKAEEQTQSVVHRTPTCTMVASSFMFYVSPSPNIWCDVSVNTAQATLGEKAEVLFLEANADSCHAPDVLRLRQALKWDIPVEVIEHLVS